MSISHQRFSVAGIREHEESRRPSSVVNVGEVERWASAIGGALLVTHGLRRPSPINLGLALLGGSLLYRGIAGHCAAYEALHIDTSDKRRSIDSEHIYQGVRTKHSVTINRNASDLYGFWHDVTNAPKFMVGIVSVENLGENRSHWVADGPLGKKVTWDSEVITDKPDFLIAWKSLPSSEINQAGSVRFEPAAGGRGTIVTLEQSIEPPGGAIGQAIGRLFHKIPEFQAQESLRHFKQLMETGEIPTIEGQSSGRASNDQVSTPLPHGV